MAADGRYENHGTPGDPELITPSGGVGILNVAREVQYLQGDGAGVLVTAVPQITRGSRTGQELTLFGTNDAFAVVLQNGNGLALNGICVLKQYGSLELVWDGNNWNETSRNDL